jgi:PBP1b-binding outer membrane lipoprotein LpoB
MKKIIAIAVIAFLLSSCGSTKPYHACGITELNKQYQIQCKSTKKPWFKRNR